MLVNKIFFLLLFLFTSCGATIQKSEKFQSNNNPYIALIPTKTHEGVSRERTEYVAALVRLNLESKGYILLTPEAISSHCQDLECSNIGDLSSKFKIGKIAHINLESSSSIDFLAGYYSSLTGQFNVEDDKGISLYAASHTQRDSGGLLLESGQVIQAIINQARSGDESSIDKVSYRFVSSLLKEIPVSSNKNLNPVERIISISKVNTSKYNQDITKVCVFGTPQQSAWLVSKDVGNAQLVETKPGEYCSAFRLEGPWVYSNNLKVELRSPFGELARAELK